MSMKLNWKEIIWAIGIVFAVGMTYQQIQILQEDVRPIPEMQQDIAVIKTILSIENPLANE